jgi:hypothetical protein
MRWETVVKAGIIGMLTSKVNNAEMAILQATGVPIAKRQIKLMTKISIGMYSMSLVFF